MAAAAATRAAPPRAISADPRRAPLGAVGVSLPRLRGTALSARLREVQLSPALFTLGNRDHRGVLVDAVALGPNASICCRSCCIATFG
jgi:hypothetical protein